jgi:hypothetical protein
MPRQADEVFRIPEIFRDVETDYCLLSLGVQLEGEGVQRRPPRTREFAYGAADASVVINHDRRHFTLVCPYGGHMEIGQIIGVYAFG